MKKIQLYFKAQIFLILLVFFASACQTVKTYSDHLGPKWLNNKISNNYKNQKDHFSLISFNIKEGALFQEAIVELKKSLKKEEPDFMLLQEMHEEAVIKISKAFKLNYLYYPIATNKTNGKNFGNAILSKYKITEPDKLILPHAKIDDRIRNATNCIVEIDSSKLLLYSIHNETKLLAKAKRTDQINKILGDISSRSDQVDFIIVGGDFNSTLKKDVDELEKEFDKINMLWPTENIGFTSRAFFDLIKAQNDHLFTKNVKTIEVKKVVNSQVSDHVPILYKFKLDL